MENGNRTWPASAFKFIPSSSRLHRDSCVVKALLSEAFWPGLSSGVSEASNMTSSFLPLYRNIFSKTYSELPVFHQNHFRTWKLLRTTGSPLITERLGGNLAAQCPSLHAGLNAPSHATCWFWWEPPRQESSTATFSCPWRIPCCLSGSPTAFPSAAELEGCLTSFCLKQVLLDSHFWAEYHWAYSSISLDTFRDQRVSALLGISFPFIFQPPNPVNYLIYCYSMTLGLFDFAMVSLIPDHKWRRMWKIVT